MFTGHRKKCLCNKNTGRIPEIGGGMNKTWKPWTLWRKCFECKSLGYTAFGHEGYIKAGFKCTTYDKLRFKLEPNKSFKCPNFEQKEAA